MASFRVLQHVLGLDREPGALITEEELAGRDYRFLLEAGAIEPVDGPVGAMRLAKAKTDDLLADVEDLQAKYEQSVESHEVAVKRVAELEVQNAELRAANEKCNEQLREALSNLDRINATLTRVTAPRTATDPASKEI